METWPSSASTLMFFQYNVQVLFFFGRYWTWVNLNYIKCLSGYWQWLMADHPSLSWSCQDTGDRMAADEGHASVNANFWHSNTPHYINEKVEQTHSILFDKWAFLTWFMCTHDTFATGPCISWPFGAGSILLFYVRNHVLHEWQSWKGFE